MEITRKTSYTRVDYDALPEGAPYQLIRGKLVMSPSPTVFHQLIIGNLYTSMREFVTQHGLGMVILSPVDVYLNDANAYQPDLVFISNDRAAIIEQRIEGAPDLVVEILSPSTARYDLNAKMDEYAAAGVREYWIVDPQKRTALVHALDAEAFRLIERIVGNGIAHSAILDGFSINLKDLFTTQHL